MKYRLYNRAYAFLRGYFWLPCPICGKKFGGHEGANSGLMNTLHSGRMVCRDCGGKADKINRKRFPQLFR